MRTVTSFSAKVQKNKQAQALLAVLVYKNGPALAIAAWQQPHFLDQTGSALQAQELLFLGLKFFIGQNALVAQFGQLFEQVYLVLAGWCGCGLCRGRLGRARPFGPARADGCPYY